MKYKIEVKEILRRVVEVEAGSASEALIKVGQDYSKGEIVLDYNDFVGYGIKECEEDKQ